MASLQGILHGSSALRQILIGTVSCVHPLTAVTGDKFVQAAAAD